MKTLSTTTGTPHRTRVPAALLLALLAFTLFPLEWLGSRWPALGDALDQLFATELAHGIGHATLFMLLGLLALAAAPALRERPWRYYGLLLAGIGQEAFQLWFKRRGLAFDDGRDLVVDLLGLTLALVIARLWLARPSAPGSR
jgi:hypothetical protein